MKNIIKCINIYVISGCTFGLIVTYVYVIVVFCLVSQTNFITFDLIRETKILRMQCMLFSVL